MNISGKFWGKFPKTPGKFHGISYKIYKNLRSTEKILENLLEILNKFSYNLWNF